MSLGIRISSVLCAATWVGASIPAHAQLVTEEIPLQPGWNAVWVNSAPEPDDLEQILAAQSPPLDYQSIWTFDANRNVADFSTDQPAGRWFFHDRDLPPTVTNLRTMQGHRGYLINMRSAGRLRLQGRPLIRTTRFTSRTSNLFGALSDPTSNPLTFEEYFSHPGAAGKIRSSGSPIRHEIFELIGDALERREITDAIGPNAAYWLNVAQDFDFSGPLDASASINGLSFGRSTARQTLVLEVPSSPSARTVTLEARSCAVLSAEGLCSGVDPTIRWLEYQDAPQAGIPVWRSLVDGLSLVVPAGVTRVEVELRARRSGLEEAARSRTIAGATGSFPVVVNVSDQQGARTVLAADVAVEPIFGRWIGQATLSHVSTHPSVQTIPLEQAETAPLAMTLLLDIPDPSIAGAAPRILDSLTVNSFRDGRVVSRRFSSILFDRPVVLTADETDPLDPFGTTGTLSGTLHIQPDDPLNPYRHRYNPEHRQGYEITRDITLKIESQADSIADELSGLDGTFGPHRLTGQYTEVLTGVSAEPITVRGNFRLERLVESAGTP